MSNTNAINVSSYPFEDMSADHIRMLCSIGISRFEEIKDAEWLANICIGDHRLAALVVTSHLRRNLGSVFDKAWSAERKSSAYCAEALIDSVIECGKDAGSVEWENLIDKSVLLYPSVFNKVVNEDRFFTYDSCRIHGYETMHGSEIMSMYEKDPATTMRMAARIPKLFKNVASWAWESNFPSEREERMEKVNKFIKGAMGFFGRYKKENPLCFRHLHDFVFGPKGVSSSHPSKQMLVAIFNESMYHLFKLMSEEAAGELELKISDSTAVKKAKRGSKQGWLCEYMDYLWVNERFDIIIPMVQKVPYMTTLFSAKARACKELSIYYTLYRLTKEGKKGE